MEGGGVNKTKEIFGSLCQVSDMQSVGVLNTSVQAPR